MCIVSRKATQARFQNTLEGCICFKAHKQHSGSASSTFIDGDAGFQTPPQWRRKNQALPSPPSLCNAPKWDVNKKPHKTFFISNLAGWVSLYLHLPTL